MKRYRSLASYFEYISYVRQRYGLEYFFDEAMRGIDRAGDYPYTAIDMLEANGQLTLRIRNGFLGFYYYFMVGLSVYA